MIVDDDASGRKSLEIVLTAKGFQVKSASKDTEALEILETFSPDVLILDWMIEDSISGLELAMVIREDRPQIPVILITGYPSEELEKQTRQFPKMYFLAKPFRPQQMLAIIRSSLSGN